MLIPCFLCLTWVIPLLARSATLPEASSDSNVEESHHHFPLTNPLLLLDASQPFARPYGEEPDSPPQPPADTEIRVAPHKVLKPSSDEAVQITEKQYLRGDWCKTKQLKQRIEEPGCVPRTIANRFCYGQCNSFFIPKQATSYNDAFKSCSFCKPYRMNFITVTLHCPGQTPSTIRKRVQRVKRCRCMAVDVP